MRIDELLQILTSKKHYTGVTTIECGTKCESPNILGIFEEDGIWYVYDTNDYGGIVVLDKGTEEEMTEALYRRVLKLEKRCKKKINS